MLYEFINEVCDILNITVPKISFDVSKLPTKTMLALTEINSCGTVIYIRKSSPNLDLLFSVAHELRHIWQVYTDEELYFAEYKPRNLCSSVEEYNLQLAEIDAHAFAVIIMEEFFHAEPLLNGLSDNVKNKIYERVDYIDFNDSL